VILADAALLTPFAILLMRPFFRSTPFALVEASQIDGASSWQSFSKISLPLARNGIATTATLIWIISWGEFLYAVNLILSPNSYPMSAILAQQVGGFGIFWPGLMALSVLASLPVAILFIFTYRLLREGLTLGAVK
jgi:multiple sugar transport system permease protein